VLTSTRGLVLRLSDKGKTADDRLIAANHFGQTACDPKNKYVSARPASRLMPDRRSGPTNNPTHTQPTPKPHPNCIHAMHTLPSVEELP